MVSHPHVLFQDQETQYNLLLSLQTELLSYIKDGVTTRDVYQHALNFIKEKKPDLEKYFVKNIGFSVRTPFDNPHSRCLISFRLGSNFAMPLIFSLQGTLDHCGKI